MTRNRWDETRALIEAGQAQSAGCGWCGEPVARPCRSNWEASVCKRGSRRLARSAAHFATIDTKQAQHDAERQIYGDMFTPQRED